MAKGSRIGEYEIGTILGEGGMGAVYLARDHRLKRDVAIKVLTGRPHASDAAQRTLQEARSAARLNHPNICTIHEVGETNDGSFIVMERVEGRPLSAVDPLRRHAHRFDHTLRRAGCRRTGARARARHHPPGSQERQRIVTPDGRVKVLDFGIAAFLHNPADDETTDGIPRRGHARDARLHGAGGAEWRAGLRAERYLVIGRVAVRDDRCAPAVRGKDAGGHGLRNPAGASAAPSATRAGQHAGDRAPLSCTTTRRALPTCA